MEKETVSVIICNRFRTGNGVDVWYGVRNKYTKCNGQYRAVYELWVEWRVVAVQKWPLSSAWWSWMFC